MTDTGINGGQVRCDADDLVAWEIGSAEAARSNHRIDLARANRWQNTDGGIPPDDPGLKGDIEALASDVVAYKIPYDLIQHAIWLGVGNVFDTREETRKHVDFLMQLIAGAVQSVIGDIDHICAEEEDDATYEIETFGWGVKSSDSCGNYE